jgi:hypothetical protein
MIHWEKIYKGLTNHILAKSEGSHELPLLNNEACLHSFTSHVLYLLKHDGKTHLRCFDHSFSIDNTTLATIWFTKVAAIPHLARDICHKYLNKLFLYNITSLEQLILPKKTNFMNEQDFKIIMENQHHL